MAAMCRSPALANEELMALYGGEREHYAIRDEDYTSEEYDLDSECGEEGRGGRGVRSSLSLEIYGLQRAQQVHFSNQEYYRRLEELKNAHLRNMAELERMYISQGREWHAEQSDGGLERGRGREARHSISSCPPRKLQRINSQEELDFHETSSGSDQSELCGEDQTFGRDVLLSPEEMTAQKQFRFQPKALYPKPQGRLSGVRVRSSSKVTVPKPFQMMLREEDRKRHKVRTRSEIELENTLLRRELEELRECQKTFRASPAPAHIHLPLFEIISRRSGRGSGQRRGSGGRCNRDSRSNRASAAASSQPFHFLERERRKREAKILAELGSPGQGEERRAFKARPMPSSVYGTRRGADPGAATRGPRALTLYALEREATEGRSDPSSDLESKSDTSPEPRGPQKSPPSKPAKRQMQLSIELVREGEWCYVGPEPVLAEGRRA